VLSALPRQHRLWPEPSPFPNQKKNYYYLTKWSKYSKKKQATHYHEFSNTQTINTALNLTSKRRGKSYALPITPQTSLANEPFSLILEKNPGLQGQP
jgi:hypothetical protein